VAGSRPARYVTRGQLTAIPAATNPVSTAR